LSVIFRGTQIITAYIVGRAPALEKLPEIVRNFCFAERSDNLQAVVTALSQMCEHLYSTLNCFVDMVGALFADKYSVDSI
jgi:hypothetical protein